MQLQSEAIGPSQEAEVRLYIALRAAHKATGLDGDSIDQGKHIPPQYYMRIANEL